MFEAGLKTWGLTYTGEWNPQVNSLYVNSQQGKELREALKDIEVVVAGKRQKLFYISGCLDKITGRTDFVFTAGNCFTLRVRILSCLERFFRRDIFDG